VEILREWAAQHWENIWLPLAVFITVFVLLGWVRRLLIRGLEHWSTQANWQGRDTLLRAVRLSSLLWIALVAGDLDLQASQLSTDLKVYLGKGIWTIFAISIAFLLVRSMHSLLPFLAGRLRVPGQVIGVVSTGTTVLIVLVALLTVLELWGAPVGPLLLVLAVATVAAAIALRDVIPNLLICLQVSTTEQVKVGDYIKLGTGEEGTVEKLGWNNFLIKGLDDSMVMVPNHRLFQATLINYGHPVKKGNGAIPSLQSHALVRAHWPRCRISS
jgi:small-conductance mechanosensitive channel